MLSSAFSMHQDTCYRNQQKRCQEPPSSAKTSDESVDAALRFAWEGVAKGLYAGMVDSVAAVAANISKKVGLLPQNDEPAKMEDLLQAVTGIPQVWGEAIDSSLQIARQVDGLGKSLTDTDSLFNM